MQHQPIDRVAHMAVDKTNLNVIMLSQWSFNPYQKLLVEQLTKLGIWVEELNCNTVFLPIIFKHRKPDVLHFQQVYPFFKRNNQLISLGKLLIFISELLILKLIGVKLVWTAHDLNKHGTSHLKLERFGTTIVAQLMDAIIVHNHKAKQEVANTFYLQNNQAKICVLPHGNYVSYYENRIDRTEAREELNIPPSNLVLLFIGWIRGNKGIVELIQTFKHLRADDVQLAIAGQPLNKELNELIEREIAGCNNIQFTSGFVPDEQIQVYMNASDAVVLPYRDILTSGAVILAMSFNKACIAPRKSSLDEVLNDSGAFLYDPDAEDGLAQAIYTAIQKRAELPSMGAYNRQIVEQWTWERVAHMTLTLYQQCLSRSK